MFSNQIRHPASILGSSGKRLGLVSSFRLAGIHVLCFSLIYAVLFGAVYRVIIKRIHVRDLEIVGQVANEYLAWYQDGGVRNLERRVNDRATFQGDRMFVRVIDGDKMDVVLSRKNDSSALRAGVMSLLEDLDDPRIIINGELWAIATREIGGSGAVLQVGKDVTSGERTLRQLRMAIIIAFFSAASAGFLVSAFLSYQALHPIREITGTMRKILSTGDMGRRVDSFHGRGELNEIVVLFNYLLDKNQDLMFSMRDSLDNVAHDFRTPLTRLHVTAERALRDGATPEEYREAVIACLEQSEHLDRLLKILMEVSAAEAGVMKLKLERFSLGELVAGVIELYEMVADDKGVKIGYSVSGELSVHADKIRIGQALANLLDNAVKFSPPGSSIEINIHGEGRMGHVSVKDGGVGIPAKDLPYIWDRLFRAENSRATPGMGLGLSFVKAIAEAHGGSATVESHPEEGSTFTVEIPLGADPG